MDISDRIKQRMTALNLKGVDITKATGVSSGGVSQWTSGITKPKGERLFMLAQVLKCEVDWLLFGESKKTKPESNAEIIGGIEPWGSETELSQDEVELPFFTEVSLAAGDGAIDVLENHGPKLRFAKSTLKRQNVDPANAACVKVAGNSMEPVLPDGSTIGVDTAKADIVDGKMYAIDHDGMLRVKMLYRVPGGGIRLKSFNGAEYPDEIYSKDDSKHIRIIGKVFWYSVLI